MKRFNILFLLTLIFALALGACKNQEETASTEEGTDSSKTENILDNMSEMETDSVANETAPDPANADSTFITYERTPCFGQCKVFKVIVYKSGYTIYRGTNFVNNIGMFQGRLTEEQMESLRATVEEINYFSFNEEYDNENVTDLPAVITSVHMNNKKLQVRNRYHGPQELQRLYDKLDLYLDQIEWEKLETQN